MVNDLLPDGRRDRIVAELRARGMLRVSELADLLGVAPVTLRRDITRLAADGVVRRLHGGAVLNEPAAETPSPSGATLRIGMLVPSLDFYWPEVIRGAQDMAAERGVALVLRGTSYEGAEFREHAAHLVEAGVDGLLMAPDVATPAGLSLLAWLEGAGVPFVLMEREARVEETALPLESVTTDHLGGAGAAVRHLAGRGHTRVGFVWNPGSPHRDEIRRGWALAVAECGLAADAFTRGLGRPERGEEAPAVAQLVADCVASGTTALLVHADREAIAIVQYCQRVGLSVPGDLSVVAYDDELAGLFTPAITAVRPPRISIGRAAMGLLVDRLRDPARPTHRMIITPKLNVRDSTGPANH